MNSLESVIGNTPLVALTRLGAACPQVRLLAKLEGNNPAGSVKDRAALSMFLGARATGVLREGMRIIEPTSGNTGIAMAMIAARWGHPITLVMPDSMSMERRSSMAAYGAHLELTPDAAGMEGAIDRAWAMVRAGDGVMFDQFANPDNWRAHYRGTGPEIWRDTQGTITHFVSSMGTTGTIMGVSRFLKEQNPAVQIVGVHPEEGAKIPGIRRWPKEYLPKIFEPERVDRILEVSAEAAGEMARRLAKQEGLFAGHSAGGALVAALTLAGELTGGGCVVVILPDRGDRYISTPLFA
ncbi:MAG: cysteine synthase CysM [Magnetococcales bacterium]|nr:cysteine synthase CysM [Magnetococcales bacterium]